MKIFDRIREWAVASDDDKVMLDRRAFLKGMAVTSAGLLVPGAAVFDVGARSGLVVGKLEVTGVIGADEVRFVDLGELEGMPVWGRLDADFRLISFDLVEKPVTPGATFLRADGPVRPRLDFSIFEDAGAPSPRPLTELRVTR